MIFNIHAGHGNPMGRGCGAVGLLDESFEARRVKDELIRQLRYYGAVAYDCTFDGNASQNAILNGIVKKCNSHAVDKDVSIHLNAGGGTGVEVYIYSEDMRKCAEITCDLISRYLGIRNRGVKVNKSLYVLRKTAAPAMLVECAFVDNETDRERWNYERVASSIAQALFATTK